MSPDAASEPAARYFHELGRAMERSAFGTPESGGFAASAAQVLTETEVPDGVDARSILQLVLSSGDSLPRQPDPDAVFGDPPVTLFVADDFYISALYWVDGTTDIHEHSFSGAFRVFVGSSLHTVYNFDEKERFEPGLRVGQLQLQHSEYLPTGAVRPIEGRHGLIHSLFHLDRPSVSVVIRTYRESPEPQLSYERPGLAYDPLTTHPATKLQMLALKSQATWDSSSACLAAQSVMADSPSLAWLVLRTWFASGDANLIPDLLSASRRHHGDTIGDYMESALSERRRQFAVMNRRRMVKSPEHRLLLALILNLPDWATIRNAVSQIVPGVAPEAAVAQWLTELASEELRGASGLHLSEPELQGVIRSLERGTSEELTTVGDRVRRYQLLSNLLR